jgi:hypothetical protein
MVAFQTPGSIVKQYSPADSPTVTPDELASPLLAPTVSHAGALYVLVSR